VYLVWFGVFGLVWSVLVVEFGLVEFVQVSLGHVWYWNYCNLSKMGFDPISTQYLLRLRTVLPF